MSCGAKSGTVSAARQLSAECAVSQTGRFVAVPRINNRRCAAVIGDEAYGSDRSGAQRAVGVLAADALAFDLSAEIGRLKSEETWHRESHNANTLVKEPDFRIVLIAMKRGARLGEHTTAGRLSIHVLDGEIQIRLPDQMVDLHAGSLLALDHHVIHDVEAREESSFLLTLTWPD